MKRIFDKIVERFGLDKCTHFLAGVAVAYAVAYGITAMLPASGRLVPAAAGWLSASVAGLAKECMDAKADRADLAATVAGGLVPLVHASIVLLAGLVG